MFGRKVIYSDKAVIDRSNVVDELIRTLGYHHMNVADIDLLERYYKGNQPILSREKNIRDDINNKIVINRAYEIVNFKTGYLVGEPVQYVNRSGDDVINASIILLNEYMAAEDKASEDDALVEDMHIYGTGYRMVLPDETEDEDEAPFEIYTLEPKNTYVVYHTGLGHKPVMGVMIVPSETDKLPVYCVYTNTSCYWIQGGIIINEENHFLNGIPIVEYPLNKHRLGSYEVCLTLLDAINTTQSNRLDGIEQFVQALLVFKGLNLEADDLSTLKAEGGICIPSDADVQYLVQQLSQNEAQTLVDDMYQMILTICCMPNRGNGTTCSDTTGTAVILHDGWSTAEATAKKTEKMFMKSEKQFLRFVIECSNSLRGTDLKLSDIDIRFTRRNYENVQGKAQTLTTLLGSDWVAPRLAYEVCGLFPDPELAFTISEAYHNEQENKAEKALNEATAIPDDSQYIDDNNTEEEVIINE